MSLRVPAGVYEQVAKAVEAGVPVDDAIANATGQSSPVPPVTPKLAVRDVPPPVGLWTPSKRSRGHARAESRRRERRVRTGERTSVERIRRLVAANPQMPEWPDFTRHVIDLAHLGGWMVAHHRAQPNRRGEWSTGSMGDHGDVDLTLCRRGVVLFAELKREGSYLSGDQKLWREEIHPDQFRLWRPSHIGEIIEELS